MDRQITRYAGAAALTAALAAALALGGCGKSNQQTASATPPQPAPAPAATTPNPPPPPPDQPAPAAQAAAITIPAGTHLRVRLDEELGSKISEPGQRFMASVADPVIVGHQTVIPRGARAEGTVIDAKPLGAVAGGALLELRIERVRTSAGNYPVATSTMERVEQGKGRRTAGFAGGIGAFGAIVGGLAGGGRGALLGGLAGAGAGTAGSAMTGNKQIVLPAETLLTFRIEKPVRITQ